MSGQATGELNSERGGGSSQGDSVLEKKLIEGLLSKRRGRNDNELMISYELSATISAHLI